MAQKRFLSILLMILIWVSNTGFLPQQNLSISQNASSSSESFTTAAAPAVFEKTAPINGAVNLPVNGVVLSWEASSTPNVTYAYCLRTVNKPCPNNVTKWISVGNNTTVTLNNLSPNTTYYWQIRAIDQNNITTEANTGAYWSFRTRADALLPGPFNKVTPVDMVTGSPTNGLVLSWSASTSGVSYEFCYDKVNNNTCDGSWTSVGNSTTVAIYNLTYHTLYFWQVRAVNANGSVQADAGTWWIFTTEIAPLGGFAKALPENGAIDQPINLTLSWSASAGPDIAYEYCLDTVNNQACDTSWIGVGPLTSVSITGLNHETLYFWQVRAVNSTRTTYADGDVWWNFRTPIAPPGGFDKSAPEISAIDQPLNLSLTWTNSEGTNVTYEYCYGVNATACDPVNGTWQYAGKALTAGLEGLDYSTTYYWQVRAVNTSGMTYANGLGNLWHFTTEASPPGPFSKISPQKSAVHQPADLHLIWSPSEGAAVYEICVDTTNNNTCDNDAWQNAGAGTSVVPSGLAYSTVYYWQVRAVNGMGSETANQEEWWSFTVIDELPDTFNKIAPGDDAGNQLLRPWLHWTSSSGSGITYQYCVDDTDDNQCNNDNWLNAGENTSVQQELSLAIDTTYYWQVRVVTDTASVEADNGTWWHFRTLPNPPTSSDQLFETDEDIPLTSSLQGAAASQPIFSLYGREPAGNLQLQSNGIFTYTPVQDFNGTITFQFTVADGYNFPAGPFTATITVKGVNDAPLLDPIADQVVMTSLPVTFIAAASDADTPYGDRISFSILEPLPAGATFNEKTGFFNWTALWRPGQANTYTFTVVVTDEGSPALTDEQKVQITILPALLRMAIIMS